MNSISLPIQRANGVTVNWTGGDSSTYVQITGASFGEINANSFVGGMFTCMAPTSAGAFAVPGRAAGAPAEFFPSRGRLELRLARSQQLRQPGPVHGA